MNESNDKASKRGIPDWAADVLKAFLEDQQRFLQVMDLAMRGISIVRAMPQAFAALTNVASGRYEHQNVEERKREMEQLAKLAQEEVDAGHPLLHAQSVVWLWGALEALIRDILTLWLQEQPEALQRDPVRRLRVRLGDYEGLAREDRAGYLLDLLEQELAAALKPGIGKFETLLNVFNLGGPAPDVVRRRLFELSQVRNAIVHHRGIADRRLVHQCPWLQLQIGNRVPVTNRQMHQYTTAVHIYAMIILQRLRIFFGMEQDTELALRIQEWEGDLSKQESSQP